jgi:membrane associated rhomboid family serine protease
MVVMFPLRDNIPSRTVPVITYSLIALCGSAFLLQILAGSKNELLIERFAMIPMRIAEPEDPILISTPEIVQTPIGPSQAMMVRELLPAAVPEWLTLFTSMFLHGGWLHLLGNLWFLYLFGDNVEDRFGRGLYLILYLASGLIAGMAHLITNFDSTVPTLGASGAIAGVMGAYLVLYPHARVLTVIPLFIFFPIFVVPAPIFLGIWFLMQIINGSLMSLDSNAGGVAWWAHIGGFAAGAALALGLQWLHRLKPAVDEILPGTDHSGLYRNR